MLRATGSLRGLFVQSDISETKAGTALPNQVRITPLRALVSHRNELQLLVRKGAISERAVGREDGRRVRHASVRLHVALWYVPASCSGG